MLVELRVHDLGVIADLDLLSARNDGAHRRDRRREDPRRRGARTAARRSGGCHDRARGLWRRSSRADSSSMIESRALAGGSCRRAVARLRGRSPGAGIAAVRDRRRPRGPARPACSPVACCTRRHEREALDRFAGCDLDEVAEADAELADIDARLADLGGDPTVLARTVALLRFQLDEIAAAAITGPDEDGQLAAEESLLAQIGAIRLAIAEARDAVAGSDASLARPRPGATDLLGRAIARLAGQEALSDLVAALKTAQADVEDVARELRQRDERLEEDPDRLEAVRRRLQLMADLRRKYGPSLADVLEFARASRAQLAELEAAEETRDGLGARRRSAEGLLQRQRSGSGLAAQGRAHAGRSGRASSARARAERCPARGSHR